MAAPASFPTNRFQRGSIEDVPSYLGISGVQINQGDFVYFLSGGSQAVAPVNQFTMNSGNELQSWSGVRSLFAGVALGNNNANDPRSGFVPVAPQGIFAYPFVPTSGTSYTPGTAVSFTQGASTGNISNSGYFNNQAVMQCSGLGKNQDIGVVWDGIVASVSGQGQINVYIQAPRLLGGLGT